MVRARELIGAEHCWLFVHDKARHMCRLLAGKNEAPNTFSVKQDPVGSVTM
jgi:hypothetical protein